MPWIIPTQNTLLKLRPIDSKQLGANEVRQRAAGDRLGVVAVRKAENNHWQVRLVGDLTIGGQPIRELYIWPGHWDGAAAALLQSIEAGRQKAISMSIGTAQKIPGGVELPVAYKSQMDNENNPTGSCNVTSSAMCLEYWGIKSPNSRQLEDLLYEWLRENGLSRHDPNHIKQAIEHFGCKDDFTTRATIPEIKKALDNGIPVIVHGYFTSFGHIIVLIGYSEKGFIVLDPYGEWTAGGYDRNEPSKPNKGERIVYSYGLIERTCLPDGGCWAHFVTRPGVQAKVNPAKTQDSAKPGTPRYFKPQEFRPNSIAAKFIAHFEGLKLEQYYCDAGVSTIGLGTTRWTDGGPIPVGATVTKDQAIALFKRDAAEFMAQIQRIVDVPLTARQIAAVLSFCYNCGWQGFEKSSLAQSINEGAPFEEIRTNFRKWAKADGQALAGLLRRRNAEAMLWEGRDDWEAAGYD
ncbi:MAG: glycoside hydrolase family protein [Microcoleus sp.]